MLPIHLTVLSLHIVAAYCILPNVDDFSQWRDQDSKYYFKGDAIKMMSIYVSFSLMILLYSHAYYSSLLTKFTACLLTNNKPTMKTVYANIMKHSICGFFTNILEIVLLLPCYCCFVFPGILIHVSYACQESFLSLESKFHWFALYSSYKLTQGYRYPIFSTLFSVLFVTGVLLVGMYELLFQLLSYQIPFVAYCAVGTLPLSFMWPFMICVKCNWYVNIQVEKKGLTEGELCDLVGLDMRDDVREMSTPRGYRRDNDQEDLESHGDIEMKSTIDTRDGGRWEESDGTITVESTVV